MKKINGSKRSLKIVIIVIGLVMCCSFATASFLIVDEGGLSKYIENHSNDDFNDIEETVDNVNNVVRNINKCVNDIVRNFVDETTDIQENEFNGSGEEIDIDITKEIEDIKKVSRVEVGVIASDIVLVKSDTDKISARLKGTVKGYTKKTLPSLKCEKSGSTAKIEVVNAKLKDQIFNNFRQMNCTLTVSIPKKMFDKIELEGISADIQIKGIQANVVKATTVSGHVDIKDNNIKELKANSTSGDVDIVAEAGKLDAAAISGDVKVELGKVEEDINLSVISGDINLVIPHDSNADVKMTTVSGDFSVFNPISISSKQKTVEFKLGKGGNDIQLKSVSGDVEVE